MWLEVRLWLRLRLWLWLEVRVWLEVRLWLRLRLRLWLWLCAHLLPVDPAWHHREHKGEPFGEAAGVTLAQLELDRVERGVDGVLREAISSRARQRVDRERLDLGHVLRLDALQADGEGGLLAVMG